MHHRSIGAVIFQKTSRIIERFGKETSVSPYQINGCASLSGCEMSWKRAMNAFNYGHVCTVILQRTPSYHGPNADHDASLPEGGS